MVKVTVLGLGAMGSRMATRLLRAGHTVTVWNRTARRADALAAAGAAVATSPRSAVAAADFVVAMVRDDAASRTVWLDPGTGALAGLRPTAIAIESSTLTAAWVRELAARCRDAGTGFLDAPVAGSLPQADAGQLIYFVGGDPAVATAAEPILKAMGSVVHRAGDSGAGAIVKLAVNALFGVQVAAVAEIIGMLARSGVDPARAADILGATPVCSPAAKAAAASMLAGAFAPMFPIALAEKDFRYAVATARTADAATPVIEAAHRVFAAANEHGLGELHLTGVARLYR